MTNTTTETVDRSGAAESSAVADLLATQSARRSRRNNSNKSAADAEAPSPITEAANLGIAEPFTVGDPTAPLHIFLRAPVIGKAKLVYAAIMKTFPDVLIGAAVTDPTGKGVDLDAVAKFWNENEVTDEETTREDLEQEIAALGDAFLRYDPDTAPESGRRHILDSIADVTWSLAGGFNEGLTRESLPSQLLEHLRPVDFADLLRAILRACRGCDTSYESDIFERFESA